MPSRGRAPAGAESYGLSPGRPDPLGATYDGYGVNFAVFSAEAEAMELCLFDRDGRREQARLPFTSRTGDIWHLHVADMRPGQLYGLRAHGPYRPEEGLRFNPAKLLLDPYARRITGGLRWSDALFGYRIGSPRGDLNLDRRDSAFAMPKAVVCDTAVPLTVPRPSPPESPLHYEMHVKGMTRLHPQVEPEHRGHFLGLCAPAILDHLTRIGVTTVQLMPVQDAITDRFLADKGLVNYWGYQTLGFFAPDPRFLGDADIAEFRWMVEAFHSAGIEVILDVVYNHTCEGSQLGPTLSFRGLDNRSYYRLAPDPRYYIDDTGCGNTLNTGHPMVMRMVLDSLRYWVEVMGVDGFRFDLATALARHPEGYRRDGAFLSALRQDPVLRGVKLVAEPWDLGPGGYQLGQWPVPFLELNDRFRDDVRRFWRGEAGAAADLARRLTGSAEQFGRTGRPASASVNFLASHDGFTLEDVVSYSVKNNLANGENNRDGHEPNFSDGCGAEGPTRDPAVLAARGARKRAMLATLFLAQGTPMLLAGDEAGNSQDGNNNAYAQDNEISWIDWRAADRDLIGYVARLAALRRRHPVLRQGRFLHSHRRSLDGLSDLIWRLADGREPGPADWAAPGPDTLCLEIRAAADLPEAQQGREAVFAILNRGGPVEVTLPEPPPGRIWRLELDSAQPGGRPAALSPETRSLTVAAGAVVIVAA